MFRPFVIAVLLWLSLVPPCVRAEGTFENLGQPVRIRGLDIRLVTADPSGEHTAWGIVEDADTVGLLGVRIPSGKLVRVDLLPFGRSHIQIARMKDGNLCIFSGVPGRFLKYDVGTEKLQQLGKPIGGCTYWLGSTIGPDGRFYVGCYPGAKLVCCDLASGAVEDLGLLTDDPRDKYVIHPAASDDNIVYCPVGLHHRELWAFDARARTKRQILPAEECQAHGAPQVWRGTDGQVYGRAGGAPFLCTPQGIEPGKNKPIRYDSGPRRVGDLLAGSVDSDGRLWLTDTHGKKKSSIATEYQGETCSIFCVGGQFDGKIYGGSFSPAHTFCYDPADGRLTDLGLISGGETQVYDILAHDKGLFLASYTGASLDFFDPRQPVEKGRNPLRIAMLSREYLQERPVQLVLGPDGKVYVPSIPVKGRLGGALSRIDPQDLSVKVWRNLVPDQSIVGCAPVPETGELFCVSSVGGGSSAIATQKEAVAFLWNARDEKIAWQGQPVPGQGTYGNVVRAENGTIYGIAGKRYYAFEPRQRKVLFVDDLPVKSVRFPGLRAQAVGPRKLLCARGDDALWAIDPSNHSVRVLARHPSLARGQGLCVLPDGTFYYGSGASLMRCRLSDP